MKKRNLLFLVLPLLFVIMVTNIAVALIPVFMGLNHITTISCSAGETGTYDIQVSSLQTSDLYDKGITSVTIELTDILEKGYAVCVIYNDSGYTQVLAILNTSSGGLYSSVQYTFNYSSPISTTIYDPLDIYIRVYQVNYIYSFSGDNQYQITTSYLAVPLGGGIAGLTLPFALIALCGILFATVLRTNKKEGFF